MTIQRSVHKPTQILLSSVVCIGLLASCATYKPEIAQGNIVTAAQVATLKPGMSRLQVQQALGTPLLQDMFNSSRWDYIYRTLSGKGVIEQRVITLFFDANNTLIRWVGQEAPVQTSLKSGAVSVASSQTEVSTNTALARPLEHDVVTLDPNASVVDLAASLALTVDSAPIASAVLAPIPALLVDASSSSALQTTPAVDAVITDIRSTLESWRSAWESKDIKRYAAHYAGDFKGEALNNAAWLSQRKRIMENTGVITLQTYNFNIIQTAMDEARASFTQSYESRRLTELGAKNLFFKHVGNEWKITSERFIKQS